VLGVSPRGKGVLKVMELRGGGIVEVSSVEKKDGFKTGTFAASAFEERHLATGDYDGRLRIWVRYCVCFR
jgi:hypothetical protein